MPEISIETRTKLLVMEFYSKISGIDILILHLDSFLLTASDSHIKTAIQSALLCTDMIIYTLETAGLKKRPTSQILKWKKVRLRIVMLKIK